MEQLNIKKGQINQIQNDYNIKKNQLYSKLKNLNDKYLNGININDINENNPQIVNSLVYHNNIIIIIMYQYKYGIN